MALTKNHTKVLKFDDETVFDGEMAGDLPNGQGTAKYADGSEYIGSWVNGLFHGSGRLHISSKQSGAMVYEGEFAAGKEHGLGVLVLKDLGFRYQGEFAEGERSGCGVEERLDGRETYVGQFEGDRRHGFGVIQRPGMRAGQVVIEKWEEGLLVGRDRDVAREFVGGLGEAAAFVAVAASKALAAQAADFAASCQATQQSRSRARRHLSTTQQLQAPAMQLQASKKTMAEKNLRAMLDVEALKLTTATKQNSVLAGENRRLEEQVTTLQKERDEAQRRCRRLAAALDKLSLEAEARVAAQEEHVLTQAKAMALEHEARMQKTAALYEDKLREARQELIEARRQRDDQARGGVSVAEEAPSGGDGDPRKAALKFTVVATSEQRGVLTEAHRTLPSPACLAGPRRMARFGEGVSYGQHAFLLQVERLAGEVDGYVGVMQGDDAESTLGFALRYFEDGLGQGRFLDSESTEGSARVRDGGWVVLQLDADGNWLSLHTPPPERKELGRISCALRKPWTPAALCVHAGSLLHVVRKVEATSAENSESLERVHPSEWRVRSKESGAEYDVRGLLHLMLRVQLQLASQGELEELLELYKRGHQRVLDAIWGRLGGTQPQVAS